MIRGKVSHEEEIDSEGSWAISYGDLVTLLMSFFVIFFSTDFAKPKEELIDSSLVEAINELKQKDLTQESLSEMALNNVKIKRMDRDNYLIFFKGISFFDVASVDLRSDSEEVLKELSQKIMPYLSNYKLIVYAYTDNTPVRSSIHRFRDNIELSALRSIAVLRKLFALGLDPNRVEITGRGILPEGSLDFMGIDKKDAKVVKSMQRTVAFVLKRDREEKR